MFGIQNLPLFIACGLLLNMAPGPDSLFIAARSASQGWRGGAAAALGVGAGTFVHVFAAALGLSALLAASATAFMAVKLAGAVYLVVIGVGLLLARQGRPRGGAGAAGSTTPQPAFAIFRQGFLTNLLNPKVALFFLAFVPQFIAADSPHKALAFIALGMIFNLNSMLWCAVLVGATTAASRHLRANGRVSERIARWLNRLIGVLFVWFGVRLAFAEAR